jgi:hypothetical protein
VSERETSREESVFVGVYVSIREYMQIQNPLIVYPWLSRPPKHTHKKKNNNGMESSLASLCLVCADNRTWFVCVPSVEHERAHSPDEVCARPMECL